MASYDSACKEHTGKGQRRNLQMSLPDLVHHAFDLMNPQAELTSRNKRGTQARASVFFAKPGLGTLKTLAYAFANMKLDGTIPVD